MSGTECLPVISPLHFELGTILRFLKLCFYVFHDLCDSTEHIVAF